MKIGLLGKKLGMTQVFKEDGSFIPITVIEAGPCPVLKVMKDGVMMGFKEKKEKNVPKPELAFYKKINVKPQSFVKKILFDIDDNKIAVGQQLTVDIFKERDFVDISGISKGKSFQGGVKRWHWLGGPDGHGSMHHRRVGSIGGSSFPSRVFKGQKLPGRMGNERVTIQNLEIVKLHKDKNLMLVKGQVPGAKGGYLEINIAKKKLVLRPKDEGKKGKNEKENETAQEKK